MLSSCLRACPLFAQIEDAQLEPLIACLGAKEKKYQKDEFVFRVGDPAQYVGIVLSGGVHVMQEDFWGNRSILTHVEPSGLFGEAFSCAQADKLPVSVVATQPSAVLLVDYKKIVTVCPSACSFHNRLIANMMRILAAKNMMLTQKMGVIAQRTTREKLLSFLSAQAIQAKNNEVIIPFNRQELADFLCVERSALSRELSNMKREGLLDYDKSRFVLNELM